MHMSSYAIITRIRDVHVHTLKHIRVQCEIHTCIYVNVYEKNTYMPRVEKEARESRKEARKQITSGNLFREKLRKLPPKLDNSDQPLVQSQNPVYPLLTLRRRRKRIDAKKTCGSTWMKKNRKIRVSRMQQFGAWIAEEGTRAGGDAERRNAIICIEMFCCCRKNLLGDGKKNWIGDDLRG